MQHRIKTILCFLFLSIHLPALAGEWITIKNVETLQPMISVQLSDKELEMLRKEGLGHAGSLLGIYLVSDGNVAQIPVAGKYQLNRRELSYTPLYTLGYNMEFEATYSNRDKAVHKRFHTPPNPASATKAVIETMYPLTDTIPYNALYFHIRFSQPMRADVNAFKSVKILDDKGKEITNAWRHRSFWLDDGKLLVLMIHPGRVKNGIHYESPLFDSGRYYTVKVKSGIADRNGNPAEAGFSKQYFVSGEDREIPEVAIDASTFPKRNSSDPVSFRFSEGMDNASVLDGVKVLDESGNVIPCTIREKRSDRIFTIVPAKKWARGNYTIALSGAIYDFSGNRLNRLFEITDVNQIEADKKTTLLKFKVE